VALAIIAIVYTLSKFKPRSRLQRTAEALGFKLAGRTLTGERDGRKVRVKYVPTAGGGHDPSYYSVSTRLNCTLDFRTAFFGAGTWKTRDLEEIAPDDGSGSPFFTNSGGRTQALLNTALKGFLHEQLWGNMTVYVGYQSVTVEFVASLGALEDLQKAVTLTAGVAAQVDAVVPQLLVTSALAQHGTKWADFAAQHELDFTSTPLSLAKSFDGVLAIARAVPKTMITRSSSSDFVLEMVVHFTQPLAFPITVQAKQVIATGRRVRKYSAVRFRETFRLETTAGDAGSATLDDAIKRELLAANDELGAVSLDHERLAVRRPTIPQDPAPLLGWLQQLATYAANVARHFEAADRGRGPYR